MPAIDSLNFAPMLITDLFKMHGGSGTETTARGEVPYIAASRNNNGVVGFVDTPKYPGGWLSLVKDGDGGAGTCFYQPAPFWPSNHVFGMEPLFDTVTTEVMLFLATTITHQCFPKYNRGFAANARRISRQRIMVPITVDDQGQTVPDWDGMTALGNELRKRTLQARDAAMATITFGDTDMPELDFAPMLITDIFPIARQAPAWLNTNAVEPGEPLFAHVTNSRARNSVSEFIDRQHRDPNPGNAITIGVDTQVVAYQPTPFYGATKVFELRSENLNPSNALVLATLLRQAVNKFSWGHKASAQRIKRTKMLVPVTIDDRGNTVPDWKGMTAYGKAMRVRTERAAMGTPLELEQGALQR
ncbi:restriction endonuclease subunit S [Corynebacterium qintianiae]|uniref:restriction endonuclease subunit S n=1 Tax=Corynebacterium qintianiae TaxID=2709392 RepID=UPI0013EB417A|nr:restriction endonuclease subunit S [Corynebacterium qintianiae]